MSPEPRPRRSPLSTRPPEPVNAGPPKQFRIQRIRLGWIMRVVPDKHIGFIKSEDFREDVFFHWSTWQGPPTEPLEELYVEFEIDDDHFEVKKQLRAKVVRVTKRPAGRKLTAADATFEFTHHHPKAQRRKPGWRSGG